MTNEEAKEILKEKINNELLKVIRSKEGLVSGLDYIRNSDDFSYLVCEYCDEHYKEENNILKGLQLALEIIKSVK